MDCRNEKLHRHLETSFTKVDGESLVTVSLKDVPLEERQKEAKKPLFLVRY